VVRSLGKHWPPFTKYHVASEPRPLRREEVLFKISQDISRVSDLQGILALVFSATLAAAIIYALVKATSTAMRLGGWWRHPPYLTLRARSYSITFGLLSGSPKDLPSHISVL